MKSSGVARAARRAASSVSVSSRRLFSSSKRWSETSPNGSSGSANGRLADSGTSSRLSRIVFEPVSTTSPRCRFAGRPAARARSGSARARDASSPVELLGKRVAQVVAAEAALDVRDRHAERAAHQRAEHGRHRVAVDEHERLAGAAAQARRRRARSAREPRRATGREPAGDVRVRRAGRGRSRRAPSQRSGCRRPNWSSKRRDLLHLLAGRREDVAADRARRARTARGASLISSPVVPKTTRIIVAARLSRSEHRRARATSRRRARRA